MTRLSAFRPAPISASELVRARPLGADERFLWLVEPALPSLPLASWAAAHRVWVESQLRCRGALLFRGFAVDGPAGLERFIGAVAHELLDYHERAAPRTRVTGKVFTSTEFNAAQPIPLHHELSYCHQWPTTIAFYCAAAATRGGRTPLADDRPLLPLIDARIRERFLGARVMYVRNFRPELEPWQDAFQTAERSVVEDYCRRCGIAWEWRDGDRLRTRQVRQAVATHPITGDTVWFNHAHMFHASSLEPEVRASLLTAVGGRVDELPRHALFGDGSEIDPAMLDEIRGLYRSRAVAFDWYAGDVLLVDNFLASHGREPYEGERRILVAMADLHKETVTS
jgi:alpha-ketoglutarate-dependent taurine dioxygenase